MILFDLKWLFEYKWLFFYLKRFCLISKDYDWSEMICLEIKWFCFNSNDFINLKWFCLSSNIFFHIMNHQVPWLVGDIRIRPAWGRLNQMISFLVKWFHLNSNDFIWTQMILPAFSRVWYSCQLWFWAQIYSLWMKGRVCWLFLF